MTSYQFGVLLALAVAATWTLSALAFTRAAQRVGSVPVNLIRLVIALALLTAICAAPPRGLAVPTDATRFQLTWLALSGVIGFFVGDLTLFRAFVLIGPRRATLLMSLAPAFAAIAGWLAFGERLRPAQSLGIFVTLVGVMWVVSERTREAIAEVRMMNADPDAGRSTPSDSALIIPPSDFPSPTLGLALGIVAAAGQGIGAVMTKHAFRDGALDPFASTQVRAAASIPLFVAFIVLTGRWRDAWRAVRDGRAMGLMTLGAIAGPVIGVSAFNASVARIPSGVTSVLAGLVPIFMLPVAAAFARERVTPRAIAGAVVAVAGVGLLAWGE